MSDLKIQIRQYSPDDIDAITAITGEVFAPVSIFRAIEDKLGKIGGMGWCEKKVEDVQKELRKNPEGCFVAEQGGRAVGYITTSVFLRISQGRIVNLAVSTEAQGGGVGRNLLEKALEYFRELGLKQATIETFATNQVAQHLYPSMGFTEVGRQINYAMAL